MLKIRLSRVGKKKAPSYRVVIADSRAPRDGRFVEILGHYNPLTEPTTFEVNADKVREWLWKGAQPTERVQKLLTSRGIERGERPTEAAAAASTSSASAPAEA